MKTYPLFVIAGTGTGLDGTLVEICSTRVLDGVNYCSVQPYKRTDMNTTAFLIDRRYLNSVGDVPNLAYTITVTKVCDDVVESHTESIYNATRHIAVDEFVLRLVNDLTPIVRI